MRSKLTFLFLLLCPVILLAQQQYCTITGNIKNLPAQAKLYINFIQDGRQIADSITLTKGNFTYKTLVAGPVQATLLLAFNGDPAVKKNSDITTIYLEKGIVQLNSKDSLTNALISGTSTNIANEELKYNLKPVKKAIAAMLASRLPIDQRTEAYRVRLRALSDSLDTKRQGVLKDFIMSHPNSIVSLDALEQLAGPIINYPVIAPLFEKLSPTVRESFRGKQINTQLQIIKRTEIGATAPDFTEKDISGKLISLSSFRGKYILLDFWATWCAPCRAENPNVVKAYERYKNQGFDVLSVSLDSKGSENSWINAVKKDGMLWTNVSSFKAFLDQAAVLYGISAIPQNFLIGPDGKIVAKNLRGEGLLAELSQIFH